MKKKINMHWKKLTVGLKCVLTETVGKVWFKGVYLLYDFKSHHETLISASTFDDENVTLQCNKLTFIDISAVWNDVGCLWNIMLRKLGNGLHFVLFYKCIT